MGKKIFCIPKDWLLSLMKATQGSQVFYENYIPKDAKVCGVDYDSHQDIIRLVIESEKFDNTTTFAALSPIAWGE